MGAAIGRPEPKKNWAPSEGAFRRFLDWLDGGVDSGGERYVEIRRRLVGYFDRRGSAEPDDLADETLNRVARRLEEEGAISGVAPPQYCYIVAKLVFLESLRKNSARPLTEAPSDDPMLRRIERDGEDTHTRRERLLDHLEECLDSLAPADRELILEYYRGEQRAKIEKRRELAVRYGISLNALGIRACRLRDKLEECVRTRSRKV